MRIDYRPIPRAALRCARASSAMIRLVGERGVAGSQIIVRQVRRGAEPDGDRFHLLHEAAVAYAVALVFVPEAEELPMARVIGVLIAAGVSEADAFRLIAEARQQFTLSAETTD